MVTVGRLTFTLNGTYLSRFEFQATPVSKRIGLSGGFVFGTRFRAHCRTIAPMPAYSTMAQLIRGSLGSILAQPCTTPASMKMTTSISDRIVEATNAEKWAFALAGAESSASGLHLT